MGPTLSLNSDVNQVLAKQVPLAIDTPQYKTENHPVYRPISNLPSIPAPVDNAQNGIVSENRTPTTRNEPSVVNRNFNNIQNTGQFYQPSPNFLTSPSSSIRNSVLDGSRLHSPNQQRPINYESSTSAQSRAFVPNHISKNDAYVVSRHFIKQNDPICLKNYDSSSMIPDGHFLYERNGKQFIVEQHSRTEKRYVQCFDEQTQKFRLFEVTDCIPIRIIRPCVHHSPSTPRKYAHHYNVVPNDQTSSRIPSNFMHQKSSRHGLEVQNFSNYDDLSTDADSSHDEEIFANEHINRILRTKDTHGTYAPMEPSFYNPPKRLVDSNATTENKQKPTQPYSYVESPHSNYRSQDRRSSIKNHDTESKLYNQTLIDSAGLHSVDLPTSFKRSVIYI